MKLTKGFTLIELLVVIAIIGILSSVVLASLSTARNKGADARVQSQLQAARAQAELYTGTGAAVASFACTSAAGVIVGNTAPAAANKVYGTVFETANSGVGNLLAGIADARCAAAAGTPSNGAAWALSAPLPSNPTGLSWCVDSTGVSKQYTGTAAAAITTTNCTP